MTCDDEALLKDDAIQKEMKFGTKHVFSSFEALLANFTETKDINEMCISMLSTYYSIYNGNRKTVHISTYKLFFKKHFKILKP